jgi:hypothetical protein
MFNVVLNFVLPLNVSVETWKTKDTNTHTHTHTVTKYMKKQTNWVHSTKGFLCIFLMSLYTSESSEHHLIAKLCTFTNLTAQETKNTMYTKQSSKTGRKPNRKFQNQSSLIFKLTYIVTLVNAWFRPLRNNVCKYLGNVCIDYIRLYNLPDE